jgi:hypothetical protein
LWVCWGRTILALAAAALALFVHVGLVRPLRFPRGPGLGQPGFPWNFKCVTLDNLELLTREEDRALRQFATRFTFYRDQRIWIDERWELRRTPQGGRVEVNLKRIDGVPTAWIAALDGVLLCTPFREGAGLPDDAESWEEVPEAGARLKLRHIYLFREDPPKRVFLFL